MKATKIDPRDRPEGAVYEENGMYEIWFNGLYLGARRFLSDAITELDTLRNNATKTAPQPAACIHCGGGGYCPVCDPIEVVPMCSIELEPATGNYIVEINGVMVGSARDFLSAETIKLDALKTPELWREQRYEAQTAGALPSATEMVAEAEEARVCTHKPFPAKDWRDCVECKAEDSDKYYSACHSPRRPDDIYPGSESQDNDEILRDRALYKLRGGKFLTIDVDLDAMVAEYNESDVLAAQAQTAAARQQADTAQADYEALINDAIPMLQADNQARFIIGLVQQLAIETARILHTFPDATAQGKQMDALLKAYKLLSLGLVTYSVDINGDGPMVHLISQSEDGVMHLVGPQSDTCKAANAPTPRTCWHSYGYRLVCAALGLALPVVEVAE